MDRKILRIEEGPDYGTLLAFKVVSNLSRRRIMFWKLVLVVGILGLLLGFAVTAISFALPIVEGPRISWEEAALGIIPGVIVLIISFFVSLVGLIFLIRNRKRKVVNPPTEHKPV